MHLFSKILHLTAHWSKSVAATKQFTFCSAVSTRGRTSPSFVSCPDLGSQLHDTNQSKFLFFGHFSDREFFISFQQSTHFIISVFLLVDCSPGRLSLSTDNRPSFERWYHSKTCVRPMEPSPIAILITSCVSMQVFPTFWLK